MPKTCDVRMLCAWDISTSSVSRGCASFLHANLTIHDYVQTVPYALSAISRSWFKAALVSTGRFKKFVFWLHAWEILSWGNSHTDRRKTLIPQDFSKHPLKTKDNADVSCGSSASWLRHLPRSWCTCTWGSRWFQCVDSIDLFSRFRPALNSIEQSIEKLAPSLHFSISPAFWASDQSFKFSHRLACEATF